LLRFASLCVCICFALCRKPVLLCYAMLCFASFVPEAGFALLCYASLYAGSLFCFAMPCFASLALLCFAVASQCLA
jgi:hypothetical protein